jgi:MoaA/NifB/PqqE/SkfB family radical SAM enzyme
MFTVDIEPTNRCNAKCHFCPRDQTPHQGLMSPEVFEQALARAVEFREIALERFDRDIQVNLCGLGEPLLNRHTPDFARQVREAGIGCGLSTNGALLDEDRGRAVLDAGVQNVYINVGDTDDGYEEVYKLPFGRTRDNVARFAEMAAGRCEVHVVLVDFRRDREHVETMKRYWRELGIHAFMEFDIINRAGALFVDHMQYEQYPEQAVARAQLAERGASGLCVVPFLYLFIGYDGQYYLCCSDWKKEVPLGSVFDVSFAEITARKAATVGCREPICKTCNHDPLNRLTDALRADPAAGAALVDELAKESDALDDVLAKFDVDASAADPAVEAVGAGPAGSVSPVRFLPRTRS